jgi:hypothetical protein
MEPSTHPLLRGALACRPIGILAGSNAEKTTLVPARLAQRAYFRIEKIEIHLNSQPIDYQVLMN